MGTALVVLGLGVVLGRLLVHGPGVGLDLVHGGGHVLADLLVHGLAGHCGGHILVGPALPTGQADQNCLLTDAFQHQCCAYRPFFHLAISDMSDNVYSRSSKSIFDFVTRHLCVQLFKTDQIKSTEVVLFWNIQVKLNHNFKHLQAKRKKC